MKRTRIRKPKTVTWKFWLIVAVSIVVLNAGVLYIVSSHSNSQAAASRIPHYFASAAVAKPLPPTLPPGRFVNRDVAAAYRAAKDIPEVLAQQPCYCYCDRHGHRSLLDCFASEHASDCDICVKEALFAMQEHRKGKSPEQIRAEIVHGDLQRCRTASTSTTAAFHENGC